MNQNRDGVFFEYDEHTRTVEPREWYSIRFVVPKGEPTIYVNGLLYRDPKRGRLFNAWLQWSWRFRHWRATRHARDAS